MRGVVIHNVDPKKDRHWEIKTDKQKHHGEWYISCAVIRLGG